MARPRTIPDDQVFAAVRHLLATGGDKAVAFASVAQATGLAAPTLVQRYGAREGMIRAALTDHWTTRIARIAPADAAAKGAAGFLRALAAEGDGSALVASQRDATLRALAAEWRAAVEAVLARYLGGGARGREAAQILFAAWQGQALWATAGDRPQKLKDLVKRLT